MRYSYVVPATRLNQAVYFQHFLVPRAEADRRWPAVIRRLESLRANGRRSIRIVDMACGADEFLIAVARQARALGFVAVEALGIDRDARAIDRARRAALAAVDPRIGLMFEHGEPAPLLQDEEEFPADIVLGDEASQRDVGLKAAARAAGRAVIWRTSPALEKAA